ncbi:catalase family peroxidase [Luteimonas yindakuii]|uniref:catalase family peroxidase n=1 Tax=Luteimonas yindakuii TaxID=2565782 RepID=UPI0011078208|nr:catalase family peroxidase [Luteimonas yindakuii]QCU72467.1 catalase family peroxidase [Luteimonas yindakuii]
MLIVLLLAAVAIGIAILRGAFGTGAEHRASSIIDTMQGGGEALHAGFRRAHARGLCVSGRFIGSGDAAALSSAPLFEGESPVLGRLSVGGGNPAAPEATAGVRSMALAITQADGQQWRMAMNTPPMLAVGTPEAFHEQLRAMASDPATGKPDPARIAAFFEAHPESAAFRAWQAGYRASDSWANTRYHSANAFVLVDADGQRQPVRWAMVPEAPFAPLGDGPHTDDALSQEFQQRLADGPVRWTLRLQLAEPGDPVDDGSRPWPDTRRTVDAGTVKLTYARAQQGGDCNGLNFDPLVLPEGIEPSADPVLHARRAAYAESLRRRARETLLEGAP